MAQRDLIVGLYDAIEFWRQVRRTGTEQDWSHVYGARDLRLSEKVELAKTACGTCGPLQVVAGSSEERPQSPEVEARVWTGVMGRGTSVGIGKGVRVSGIKQALVQLGLVADTVDILMVAYEFCGTYALAESEPRGFVTNVEPLVSAKELRDYAEFERGRGVRGAAAAAKAFGYLIDGSNSPYETKVAIALSLPRQSGGYNLGGFKMNAQYELTGPAATIFGYRGIRPDFSWPDSGHALEVLGRHDHGGDAGFRSDPKRADALLAMGITVHWATTEQLRSLEKTEAIFEDLGVKLGKRRAPLSTKAKLRRAELHDRLFGHGALAV